jgi:hypothetical protein
MTVLCAFLVQICQSNLKARAGDGEKLRVKYYEEQSVLDNFYDVRLRRRSDSSVAVGFGGDNSDLDFQLVAGVPERIVRVKITAAPGRRSRCN